MVRWPENDRELPLHRMEQSLQLVCGCKLAMHRMHGTLFPEICSSRHGRIQAGGLDYASNHLYYEIDYSGSSQPYRGHLKVEVVIDAVNGRQVVVDAKATGTMFRGIETILTNRNPQDAPDITQRICGVCPVSHALAASSALENAARITVPTNARILRNLVLAANFLQSHILHFYVLSALISWTGRQCPVAAILERRQADCRR